MIKLTFCARRLPSCPRRSFGVTGWTWTRRSYARAQTCCASSATSRVAAATPEGGAAGAELIEDEKRFIDHGRSPLWFGSERLIIG